MDGRMRCVRSLYRRIGPGLAARAWVGAVALLLSVGCASKRFVMPDQPSVGEQYRFAVQQDQLYRSPLNRPNEPTRIEMAAQAIAAYQRVLERYPREERYVALSRLGIAMIQDREGRDREALKAYEALIEQYPEVDEIQINSLYGAAVIYDKLKQYERAKQTYQQVIARYANSQNEEYKRIVQSCRMRYQMVRKR